MFFFKFIAAILMDFLPFILIMILSVLYLTYIPEHWGKLTLITTGVIWWFSAKILVKLRR